MSPDSLNRSTNTGHNSIRHVQIRMGSTDEIPCAMIVGGGAVTELAVGQQADIAIGLSEALFGFCPAAHVAAFLSAAEYATGQKPPASHLIARSKAVLSEALASCVWRQAVDWPQLVDAAPDLGALKTARQLAKAYREQLFDDDWHKVGGVAPAQSASDTLLLELAHLTSQNLDRSIDYLTECPAHEMRPMAVREETPLSLLHYSRNKRLLSAWYSAQAYFARQLCDACENIGLLTMQGRADFPGMALTARGRLFHQVYLHENKITSWTVQAPTDVNFAASGPVSAHLRHVDDRTLVRWIVAAYDPCMPVSYIAEPVPEITDA